MKYEDIEEYKKQGDQLELIASHTLRHLNSFMDSINKINFNIQPNINNISEKTDAIKDSLSKNRIKLNEQLTQMKMLDISLETDNNNILELEIEEIYTIPYLVELKNDLIQDLDFSIFEKSHNDLSGSNDFNMLTHLIGIIILRITPLLNKSSIFAKMADNTIGTNFEFYFDKEKAIQKLIIQQTSHDQLVDDFTAFRVKASFISQDFTQILQNTLKDLNTIYRFLEKNIQ